MSTGAAQERVTSLDETANTVGETVAYVWLPPTAMPGKKDGQGSCHESREIVKPFSRWRRDNVHVVYNHRDNAHHPIINEASDWQTSSALTRFSPFLLHLQV